MFQQEFRELVSLLINVLCAVVVIAAIVFGLQLKNKVGVATSEVYNVQKTMDMHYEFNAYDGTLLTADECIAAFANYINSDVSLCIIDKNINSLKNGKIWNSEDYRKNPSLYSADNIKLGKNDKGLSTDDLYFKQDRTYDVYISYDEEDPLTATDRYYCDRDDNGTLDKPLSERQFRPSRVSSITFVANRP